MKETLSPPGSSHEEAFYRESGGEQMYCVFHRSHKPVAQVLLAGHFVTERTYAYAPWVRWARHLADRGLSALRFDYRGCGESEGAFETFTLSSWLDDCRSSCSFLKTQEPDLPIVLSGIGMGGLLAAQLFQEGLGDSMLLWSAFSTGADALRDTLMRRLAFDLANSAVGTAKTWAEYQAGFERGGSLEANGYVLTAALWREAVAMRLVLPEGGRESGVDRGGRAWRVVKLGRSEMPLVAGGGLWQAMNPRLRMRRFPLNPDLRGLFEENVRWIMSVLPNQGTKAENKGGVSGP